MTPSPKENETKHGKLCEQAKRILIGKGFIVSREWSFGKCIFDVIGLKEDEVVVIEIQLGAQKELRNKIDKVTSQLILWENAINPAASIICYLVVPNDLILPEISKVNCVNCAEQSIGIYEKWREDGIFIHVIREGELANILSEEASRNSRQDDSRTN